MLTSSSSFIHTVFSTAGQEPVVSSAASWRLYDRISAIIASLDCRPFQVGGAPEHVHALFAIHHHRSVEEMVEHMKSESATWLAERLCLPDFHWQEGYAAFSVGRPDLAEVLGTILRQDEIHRHISFRDEYRRLIEEHDLVPVEQEMWI